MTLTVNPAIDRTVTADRLVFEDRAYITSTSESAGGRGINAATVIQSFGGQALAIAPSGGSSGTRFRQLLRGCPAKVQVVPIRNRIRTNLTVTDRQGLTVKLNERGPELSLAEVGRLERNVRAKLEGASWLMLCGSLPPGVPSALYVRLIQAARRQGVRTLLDTDGDALRDALEAAPTVVTPNQQEAERLLHTVLLTRTQFLAAARRIREMGAESVVLSLGDRGAIGARDGEMVEAEPPRIQAVCPIGAGDALAAAFVWAMERRDDFSDAVRWGVAAGTASAKLPGVQFASLRETRGVYKKVEVRPAE